MKCVLCDQRKAKRLCPASNTFICPQCCGDKRVLEIHCPESCEYLKAGREREAEDYRRHIQRMDPATYEKYKRVLVDYQEAVAHLEYVISRERILSRDLKDNNVAQAVEILIDTYRTEDKGVLYEKTSDDLRVESLRRELRKTVESFRNPEGKESQGLVDARSSRMPLSGAIECLEFIRSLIVIYMEDRGADSGYVDFLARITPREETKSSIIMP
jgi:hypothetical protein